MKILLAQNVQYYPAHGGSNKSNRILLEELVRLGDQCMVVATTPKNAASTDELTPVAPVYHDPEVAEFSYHGVEVHAVKTRVAMDVKKLKSHFIQMIHSFDPDIILISTEDVGQVLLDAAIQTAANRVVYLARTTLYLPMGPDCYLKNPSKAELLKRAAGIISVGAYVTDYLKMYGGVNSVILPISVFGHGPFPQYHNAEDGYILMVNPCAYKGITIFLQLAEHFPQEKFAAIPTWGTTSKDYEAMKKLDNITIFDPFENMDDIFCKTKIVLVPSLWAEAKSRTIVEGMLRGIPVLASDVGGNREAKLGVDYTLPVHAIEGYSEMCDEKSLPVTAVEKQDMEPWFSAVDRLIHDRKHYEQIAEESRMAALEYVEERGGCEKVHEYLEQLAAHREEEKQQAISDLNETAVNIDNQTTTQRLSAEQKALLLLRLKKRKGGMMQHGNEH